MDDHQGRRAARAIIVGAGPGGLTAAAALRRVGIEALVYEQAGTRRDAGAGLTLWPNALKALDAFGLGATVRAAACPCDGIAVRSCSDALLSHTPRDVMAARFGGTGVALHRGELITALAASVGKDTVHFGAPFVSYSIETSGVVHAMFADGTEVLGDLLVGADGIRSQVRRQLLGPRPLRVAGCAVWRGITSSRAPSATTVGTVWLGRGLQFGLFPMTQSRAYWFAGVSEQRGRRGPPPGAHLAERFRDWPDPVVSAISSTPPSRVIMTDVYDIDPLPRWGSGPVTILGDAAHASTPDLGQGACQAIEDAIVLADCVRRSVDVVAALHDYEARRVRRANSLLLQARRMARLGRWDSSVACRARDQLIKRMPDRSRLRQLDALFAFAL